MPRNRWMPTQAAEEALPIRGIPCKYPLQAKTYKNVTPPPQTAKGLLPANTGTVPLLFSIQADKSFIQPSAYAIRP